MNALHEQFIVEARELIQQANNDLIAAEHEGFSSERIDRVFRVFHTLKGSAAVVDLPPLGLILHAARGRIGGNSDRSPRRHVRGDRGVLTCLDQAAKWVDDFEAREALPAKAGEVARGGWRKNCGARLVEARRSGPPPRPDGRQDGHAPDWVRSVDRAQRALT